MSAFRVAAPSNFRETGWLLTEGIRIPVGVPAEYLGTLRMEKPEQVKEKGVGGSWCIPENIP